MPACGGSNVVLVDSDFLLRLQWAARRLICKMFAATGAVATEAVARGAVVVVIFNLCHYCLLLAVSTGF